MNENQIKYLREEMIEAFWARGNLRDWYLKPKQRKVLDFLRDTDEPFHESSRRIGKTTTALSFVCEESNRNPGLVTKWCEPEKNQCREIVMTEMDQIQRSIPHRYRFLWRTTDSYYESAWNGSRIYLRGVNHDRGESARGTKANIVVADEIGNWRDPVYIVNDILLPQLLTTKGKLIKIGTPPKNLAHAYYKMKRNAINAKKYLMRTIHEQEVMDWESVERIVAEMGGWDSVSVRRELLCEEVVDPSHTIVPEWNRKYVVATPPDEFFPFYLKYDGLDIGVRDLSVTLIAYYDFRRAKLVVLDEIVMNGPEMTTERMAERIRACEKDHFDVSWEEYEKNGRKRWRCVAPPTFRMRRVSDIDLLLINDLKHIHGLHFDPTDKGGLEEMVNELRIWVGGNRIEVHPRCEILIESLRCGLWNERRTEWERDENLGHFDAIAALMYLVRNVDTRTNPIPLDFGKPAEDWFFTDDPKSSKKDKLRKVFGVR